MKKIFFITVISALFFACEDKIDLDLKEGKTGLVVDGLITTLDGPQKVKLSLTASYTSNTATPKVSGAVVKVEDDLGNEFYFTENQAGEYLSDATFKGEVGRKYTLTVWYDGKEYQSEEETLTKVPAIENIRYYFEEASLFNEEGYFVYFDFQDDADEKNAYRWIQTYNDTLANSPYDLLVTTDVFFNGNYVDSISYNEPLKMGDRYEIQMWSLSENAVSYLQQIKDQITGSGGPFSVPPAPVYGNVRNVNDPDELVWGYFGASDIVKDSVEITP